MRESPGGRLFLAIPIPDAVREEIAALVNAQPVTTPPVRWVRIEGLHLTLRFLGQTSPERAGLAAEIGAAVASDTAPFDLTVAGAGAFPTAARPRVLWLGLEAGTEPLAELVVRLADDLVAAGWPPDERPFRPHLTLARVDGLRAGREIAAGLVASAAAFSTRFQVNRLALMRTHADRGPARYEEVASWPLAG